MARKKATKGEPKPPEKAPKAPASTGGGIPKDLQNELLGASVEHAVCQKAYLEAHAEAKACKEALDAQTDRIIKVLREARTGQARLPFDEKDGDWRGAKFSDRAKFPSLKPRLVGALHDAGIDTLGQLVDRQKDARFRLSDVKGIGEKAQKIIEDACEKFHERRKVQADNAAKTAQALA